MTIADLLIAETAERKAVLADIARRLLVAIEARPGQAIRDYARGQQPPFIDPWSSAARDLAEQGRIVLRDGRAYLPGAVPLPAAPVSQAAANASPIADLQARILTRLEGSTTALGPLADALGVSRSDVRAALDELERAGRVRTQVLGAGSVGWALPPVKLPSAPAPVAKAAPAPAPKPAAPKAPVAEVIAPQPAAPERTALAETTQRDVLFDKIRENPALCGTELAAMLGWSPNVVSTHAQHLETEGRIRRRRARRLIGDRRMSVMEFWATDAPEPPPTPVPPRQGASGQIIALLAKRPGMTAAELAVALDMGKSIVGVTTVDLERVGKVVRVLRLVKMGRGEHRAYCCYLPGQELPTDALSPVPAASEQPPQAVAASDAEDARDEMLRAALSAAAEAKAEADEARAKLDAIAAEIPEGIRLLSGTTLVSWVRGAVALAADEASRARTLQARLDALVRL